LLGRSSRGQVLQSLGWGGMLVAARLRGPRRGASRVSPRVLWQRLVWDREAPPVVGAASPDTAAAGDAEATRE
jgi:hypothetical protein